MDSFRSVLRVGLWWCFLLCVLPVTANAATRQIVKVPSHDVALSSQSVATKGTGVLQTAISEGEYIAGHTLDRKTPIKVLKRIDYSIPRTITAAKNLLKNNLAQALLSATIAGAVGAAGWVMSPDNTELQRTKLDAPDGAAPGGAYYVTHSPYNGSGGGTFYGYTPDAACSAAGGHRKNYGTDFCELGTQGSPGNRLSNYNFSSCASGIWFDLDRKKCVAGWTPSTKQVPVTDSDIDTFFPPYVSSQTADWTKQLLKDACSGSIAPQRCFDELKDSRMVSGPSSVTGPSTTTTGTYTRPDGTTGTVSSTTNTNYDISYGPTYFDYTENKTVTNYKDGTKTDESTTSDTPEVTDEKPEEEKDETSPCTQNCHGPAYVDMYQPSTDTKEQKLDSYSSRFKSVPIFAAASNMFTLSVSGGACPVWQYHGSLSLLSVSADMPIDLVFDYHCLPWFVDLGPFIKAIILIGFTYIAFRIGVL